MIIRLMCQAAFVISLMPARGLASAPLVYTVEKSRFAVLFGRCRTPLAKNNYRRRTFMIRPSACFSETCLPARSSSMILL